MTKLALIALQLENDVIVLQRRSRSAKDSPGMLGLFGGHVQDNESPEAAIVREVGEETSLDPKAIGIEFLLDSTIHDREMVKYFNVSFFKAYLENDSFDVFEGDGKESVPLIDIAQRNDIAPLAKDLLNRL